MITLMMFLAWTASTDAFYQGEWQGAIDKARSEQKYLVVDVYTEWCGPCRLMKRTTFKNQNVLQFLGKDVVGLQVDAEKGWGRDFAKKYQVNAFPCQLVLDKDGNEITRRYGYMSPRVYLDWVSGSVE